MNGDQVQNQAKLWQDGRLERKIRSYSVPRIIGVTLATLGIFALDTFTSMSSAIAILYVLVLVTASNSRSRRELLWICTGCVGLTVASFFTDHSLTKDPDATLRLLFSIVAMVTVTTLLLRNLETRLRHEAQALLLDATADAIVLRDLNGTVLLWNRGAERLYGVPRSAMVGRIHHDVLHSGFTLPFAVIEQQLLEASAWNGEIQQERHDGSVVTVASRWTLQRDHWNHPWAVLETSTDISARRAADQAFRQSEQRYRSIFETLAVAVLEYDFTGFALTRDAVSDASTVLSRHIGDDAHELDAVRSQICVVSANPKALMLMGFSSPNQLHDEHCGFLPLSNDDLRSCLAAMEIGDTLFEREATAAGPNGEVLTLNITLHFPVAGEPVDRVQCSMVDLTEHKRMADDLARMRSDLEHVMRATTVGEVSATIAHEVNQPLAAISTYAEAAKRWIARGPEHQSEAMTALSEVARAAGHAGDIVKGVRRLLSRSEREDLPIDFDDMVVESMRLVRREIAQSQVDLILDLASNKAFVSGDRLLLQQAVVNLAINAIQAMEQIAVPRRLTLSTQRADETVVLTVRDNGLGFSQEIVSEALNAFASTRPGGIGLGLAICRSAIEAHGGSIHVGNDDDGGALVTLHLPIL